MISIKNVFTKLDEKIILDDLSCTFPSSKISIIIGRSGAGKSTLLKTMVRFYNYSGSIIYNNRDIKQFDLNELRREVAYVGQIPVVFPGTVYDNMIFPSKYWKISIDDEYIDTLLNLVGLDTAMRTQNASTLSIGQKQRLHLARTLSTKPTVLLLDEPASALDVISKHNFEELIINLDDNNPELTIIIVTHDLNQARRIGEYLILLESGSVIIEKEKKEFFSDYLLDDSDTEDGTLLENLINKLTGGIL